MVIPWTIKAVSFLLEVTSTTTLRSPLVGSLDTTLRTNELNNTWSTVQCSMKMILSYFGQIGLILRLASRYLIMIVLAGRIYLLLSQVDMIRRRTPVLLQVYLPSGLFVIVSWISFIVPPEVVPGLLQNIISRSYPEALIYSRHYLWHCSLF